MQRRRSQPAQSTGCARISSVAWAVSNPRVPVFRSRFPLENVNEPRLTLKVSRWSCAGTGNLGQSRLELGPAVCFRVSPWLDRSKSGKSKGACTRLGQINAAALNIRPSVRDRDRDGLTILLVGDLDFGTKGERFVRRRHGVIVERDAAGSFGSRRPEPGLVPANSVSRACALTLRLSSSGRVATNKQCKKAEDRGSAPSFTIQKSRGPSPSPIVRPRAV
jgi:hypothetical protein